MKEDIKFDLGQLAAAIQLLSPDAWLKLQTKANGSNDRSNQAASPAPPVSAASSPAQAAPPAGGKPEPEQTKAIAPKKTVVVSSESGRVVPQVSTEDSSPNNKQDLSPSGSRPPPGFPSEPSHPPRVLSPGNRAPDAAVISKSGAEPVSLPAAVAAQSTSSSTTQVKVESAVSTAPVPTAPAEKLQNKSVVSSPPRAPWAPASTAKSDRSGPKNASPASPGPQVQPTKSKQSPPGKTVIVISAQGLPTNSSKP